ncbi:MAG: hypothetical protein EAZ59_23995 [Oscillatoriales cyanobacterium]|nr:MAG: hypothetical protein EAZ59_23995 [Oscillatoriales cyanobacterium]
MRICHQEEGTRKVDKLETISVNLRPNPVTDYCLTINPRSPLTPRSKGGTGVRSFVPLPPLGGLGGGWGCEGDLDSGKNQISQGFQAIVDTNG